MRLEIAANLFLLVYGQKKKGNKRNNNLYGEWDADWDTCDAECGGGYQVYFHYLENFRARIV